MATSTEIPRSRALLWTWDHAWDLGVFAWFLLGPLRRHAHHSPIPESSQLPLPLQMVALWLLFVAGPLLGLLVVAAIRKTTRGRAFLEQPVRSPWLRRRLQKWSPALALGFHTVFSGTFGAVLTIAGLLLASQGILPGPGRTRDTLLWVLAAVVAFVVAVVVFKRFARRELSRPGAGLADPSES